MNSLQRQSLLAPTPARPLAKDFSWPQRSYDLSAQFSFIAAQGQGRIKITSPVEETSMSFRKMFRRMDTFQNPPRLLGLRQRVANDCDKSHVQEPSEQNNESAPSTASWFPHKIIYLKHRTPEAMGQPFLEEKEKHGLQSGRRINYYHAKAQVTCSLKSQSWKYLWNWDKNNRVWGDGRVLKNASCSSREQDHYL